MVTWKGLKEGFVDLFQAGDPIISDLRRWLHETEEVLAVAKETDLAWTPYGPDDEGEHLEWPLMCHTRAGKSYVFENAHAFEYWLSQLVEIREGNGTLVRREPPSGMTVAELDKLIGLAVSRGAKVEPVEENAAFRALANGMRSSEIWGHSNAEGMTLRETSQIEQARKESFLVDDIIDRVYGDERLRSTYEVAKSRSTYKPVTTNDRGVTFHAPDWDWATRPGAALVLGAQMVGAVAVDAKTWTVLLALTIYVIAWLKGADQRWGDS